MVNQEWSVDVAVVGAGGAGLSLVLAIDAAARRAGVAPPTVAVIDPVHRAAADRTWCWWTPAGEVDPLVYRAWSRVELVDRRGEARDYDLGDLRYVMLRSSDFYAAADAVLARWSQDGRARRLEQAVMGIQDGAQRAVVHTGSTRVAARWVLDSRPAPPARPGSVHLLQHFRGWTVRFDQPVLDPTRATLMDFGVPQPNHGRSGIAFTYCLPLAGDRALVEYTEFSRDRLETAGYDAALTGYLERRWQVGPGRGAVIEAVEDGVIPMTDAVFARVVGRRVFRIGTAGGATRPSTGYTFATMRRQAAAMADALIAGRSPLPPRPHRRRHRWMDAILLRALDRGYLDGPDLFTGLFAANSPHVVLRFLDGASSPLEELALMRSAPLTPMLRAAMEDAAGRLARRIH